jgi:hypothetical protein
MAGRLDASDRGINIRVEEDPIPRVGVSGLSSRHAISAVQAVTNGRGSAIYAEGHSTVAGAPAVAVRGYGDLLRIERWDGTKWVVSSTLSSAGTLDVEELTVAGSPITGGGTPANTVVTETSFGQASATGVSTNYARQDHTHGTPASPTVPAAANTVVTETDYNQASTAGAAATFSRSDHSHGTPPSVLVTSAYITSGDIGLPNTSSAWSVTSLSALGELVLAAAVGDWIEVGVNAMRTNNHFVDVAVVTGAGPTAQRYMATGTSSAASEGNPGWYGPAGFALSNNPQGFTVEAGDLDTGTVRLRMALKTNAASGTLYASTTYPFYWQAKNFRA